MSQYKAHHRKAQARGDGPGASVNSSTSEVGGVAGGGMVGADGRVAAAVLARGQLDPAVKAREAAEEVVDKLAAGKPHLAVLARAELEDAAEQAGIALDFFLELALDALCERALEAIQRRDGSASTAVARARRAVEALGERLVIDVGAGDGVTGVQRAAQRDGAVWRLGVNFSEGGEA